MFYYVKKFKDWVNNEMLATTQNHSSNYGFSSHAKQLGKGVILFVAGVFGYFGFSYVFGDSKKASRNSTDLGKSLKAQENTSLQRKSITNTFEGRRSLLQNCFLNDTRINSEGCSSYKPAIQFFSDGRCVIGYNSYGRFSSATSDVVLAQVNSNCTISEESMAENTHGEQYSANFGRLPNDKFFGVWQSDHQGGYNIFTQLFFANKTKDGGEFQVNFDYIGDQNDPKGKVIGNKVVVAWFGPNAITEYYAVKITKFDFNGKNTASTILLSDPNADVNYPDLAVSQNGEKIAVSYLKDYLNGTSEVNLNIFNSNLTSSNSILVARSETEKRPAITSYDNDKFAIFYECNKNICGKAIDPYGNKIIVDEFNVNDNSGVDYTQSFPQAVTSNDGITALAWLNYSTIISDVFSINVQFFNSSLGKIGEPYSFGGQYKASVTSKPLTIAYSPECGLFFVWADNMGGDYGVYGRLINNTFAKNCSIPYYSSANNTEGDINLSWLYWLLGVLGAVGLGAKSCLTIASIFLCVARKKKNASGDFDGIKEKEIFGKELESKEVSSRAAKSVLGAIREDEKSQMKRLQKLNINFNDEIKIIKKLGEGGFAVVYKATWNGQSVAFKCMLNTMSLLGGVNEHVFEEFEREMKTIKDLKHPNIVQFFGVSLLETRLGFIMELMECSLQQHIDAAAKKTVKFSWSLKLQLILGVLSALIYIHKLNIAHRDLKPENILLTNDRTVAKLGDFGFAKEVDKKSENTKHVGTVFYMAPEIAIGKNDDLLASDMHAFWLTVYAMVNCDTPFKEFVGKGSALQFGMLNGKVKRPELDKTKCPPLFIEVMNKGYNPKDPSKRFTAKGFHSALFAKKEELSEWKEQADLKEDKPSL